MATIYCAGTTAGTSNHRRGVCTSSDHLNGWASGDRSTGSGIPRVSLLIQDGLPINVISASLGPANQSIKNNIYSHLLPGMNGIAVDPFEMLVTQSILGPDGPGPEARLNQSRYE
ncbi:MAG: hypothetical protein ACYC1M_19390 [Armatimonadota bacterium]